MCGDVLDAGTQSFSFISPLKHSRASRLSHHRCVERHQHVRLPTSFQLLERGVTCVRTGRWDLRVISKVVSTMRSGLVHSPYSPPSKRSVSGAMQTQSEVTDASVWSITSIMRPSARRKLRFCAFTATTYKHINLLHQKPSRSSRR